MLPTVPDPAGKRKKKQAWKEVARHPLLSVGPAGPARAAQKESWSCESCSEGEPTAAAECHCCWTAAGTYVRTVLYLYTFGLRMCSDSTTTHATELGVDLPGFLAK